MFAGVIQNSNEKVRQDILEDNRKAAIFWATIQLIFWSFSLIMSRIDPEYTDCLPVYIIVLVICGIALFLALYVCPKHLRLVPAVTVALNIALLGAGLGITVLKPHLRSAVIFCTLLIVPVSYVTDTLSTIVLILIDFLMLVIVGSHRMDPAIFRWTVTFFVIFGLVGILMGHFINRTRFERYVFAESAMQLAELQTRYVEHDIREIVNDIIPVGSVHDMVVVGCELRHSGHDGDEQYDNKQGDQALHRGTSLLQCLLFGRLR